MDEPRRTCSKTAEEHALDKTIQQNEAEHFRDIFKAAKIIPNKLEHYPKWRFSGTFQDFKTPIQWATLIRWILVGPNITLDHQSRQKSVDKMLLRLYKTNRQISYVTKAESSCRNPKLTFHKVIAAANPRSVNQPIYESQKHQILKSLVGWWYLSIATDQLPAPDAFI